MNSNTTTRKRGQCAIVLALLLVFFTSCDYRYLDGIDKFEPYTYSPVFAIPLVNSSLGFNDFINMDDFENLTSDEENLITLIYQGEIFSIKGSEIFSIDDQVLTPFTINNIIPAAGSGSVTLPTQTEVVLIKFPKNEILTWISFLEGRFKVSASAPLLIQDGYSVVLEYKILGSQDSNGNPIRGNFSPAVPENRSLKNCQIEFSNEANFLLVEYTVTVSGNGNPANAPYTIEVFQEFSNIEYGRIRGYVDIIDFPVGSTTIPVDIFNTVGNGAIYFANPSIEFNIKNSFGLPINLYVKDFFALLPDESVMNITGPVIENPWAIDFSPQPTDEKAVTIQIVNNNNTNLFQITEQSPKEITYNVRGVTNPGSLPVANNWLDHDSNLSIDVNINLPLWGWVNNFNVKDTTDISNWGIVNGDTIANEPEWVEIRLQISNGFPLDADLRLIMLDENFMVTDTLFKEKGLSFKAAPVNSSTHLVTQPGLTTITEMIDRELVNEFMNAKYIVLDAIMKTYDQEQGTTVKILDTYRINIELGVRVKASITINPFADL